MMLGSSLQRGVLVSLAWAATTVLLVAEAGDTLPKSIKYKPPGPDLSSVRVESGVRGGSDSVVVSVLAPEHPGLTIQEQPSLFWFQSKATDKRCELTLVERKKSKPAREWKISCTNGAGIQGLRLAAHNITLSVDIEYEWEVALIVSPTNSSADVFSKGVIKRVEPWKDLSAKLKKASKEELPFIYAEEGIWYDSLEALSNLIEATPNDLNLRQLRADLLVQVGLTNAADYEIKLVKGK